jgi:hypothetical protein
MSVKWYFRADPILQGSGIKFTVNVGTEPNHRELGSIIFSVDEWSSFAKFVYLGTRAAGVIRVGIQFRDRTHTKARKPATTTH